MNNINIKQPVSSPPIRLINGYEKNKNINTYQQQDQNVFNMHIIHNKETNDNIINKPSTPTYFHINKENRKKLRNKLNNQNFEESIIPSPDHPSIITLGPGSQAKLEYEKNDVYNKNNILSNMNDTIIDLGSSLSNKLKLSDCLIINNDNDLPVIDILAHVQDEIEHPIDDINDDYSDDISVHTLRTATNTSSDKNTRSDVLLQNNKLHTPMNRTYLHNFQPQAITSIQAKQYRHIDKSQSNNKQSNTNILNHNNLKQHDVLLNNRNKNKKIDNNITISPLEKKLLDENNNYHTRYFGAIEVESEVALARLDYNEAKRRQKVTYQANNQQQRRGLVLSGIIKYIKQATLSSSSNNNKKT